MKISGYSSSKKASLTWQCSVLDGLFPLDSRNSLWTSSPIKVNGRCWCQPTGSILSKLCNPRSDQVLPGLALAFRGALTLFACNSNCLKTRWLLAHFLSFCLALYMCFILVLFSFIHNICIIYDMNSPHLWYEYHVPPTEDIYSHSKLRPLSWEVLIGPSLNFGFINLIQFPRGFFHKEVDTLFFWILLILFEWNLTLSS